jgi:hypothetical protein
MNRERASRGLATYRTWSALNSLAADRAANMAATNTLSHTAAGGNIGTALTTRNVTWYGYGEAIGYSGYSLGSQAANHLFSMWMNSSPHRALILSSSYNYVGVGVVYKSSTHTTWASIIFSESPDHTRPVAKNGTLTRSGTTVTFRWSGADPRLQTHTAGLRSFDVQYRVDSGAWKTVRDNTTGTAMVASNRAHGHYYGFRVQAADRRGNLGSWTSEKRIWVP